jgi:hypothetical protein
MKKRLLLFLILLVPSVGAATHATGNDDSTTAGDMASCNASFQQNCPDEHTEESIHSDTHAAPVGRWGNSALETIVLIMLMSAALKLRMMRRPAALEDWQ